MNIRFIEDIEILKYLENEEIKKLSYVYKIYNEIKRKTKNIK